MKYTQIIGISVSLTIIALCYLPWSIVESANIVIKGMDTTGTDFGRPGLLNIFLCSIMTWFFALPKIWAKRTNLFVSTLQMAWCIRNYILVTTCLGGECPTKQLPLFALLFCGIVAFICALFPKVDINTIGAK
jgi:hypothetical protein